MSTSRSTAVLAVFLMLNLLFFNLVTSYGYEPTHGHHHRPPHCPPCPSPPYQPVPPPSPPYQPVPPPSPPSPRPSPPTPRPSPPSPRPSPPVPSPPSPPSPRPGPGTEQCPIDALKLGVCVDVLGGLLNLTLGTPPKEPCCSLLQGVADLEAAVCLCTVLRGSILGIRLNLPINLSLLLNYCGKRLPTGFMCMTY